MNLLIAIFTLAFLGFSEMFAGLPMGWENVPTDVVAECKAMVLVGRFEVATETSEGGVSQKSKVIALMPSLPHSILVTSALIKNIQMLGAIALFKAKGWEVLPEVIRTIATEPDLEKRYLLVEALDLTAKDADVKPAVPSLLKLLKNRDARIRQTTILVLKAIRDGASVTSLIEALDDIDARVRCDAATCLAEFGSDAAPAVPRLTHMLKEDYSKECGIDFNPAVHALRVIGKDAALPVAEVFEDNKNSGDSRYWAYICLLKMDRDSCGNAVPVLAQALSDREPIIRERAAQVLRRLGPRAKDAAGPLRKLAASEPSIDTVQATMALYSVDPKLYDPIPALALAAKAMSSDTRLAAIRAVQDLQENAESAIPILREVIRKDVDSDNRVAALYALAGISQSKNDLRAYLRALVDDRTQVKDVRSSAEKLVRNLE